MPNGKVKNYSSKELWVVKKDDGPAIAYRLAPGYQSPDTVDADGFRAVDGTPVDGHSSWVKIIDLATAEVRDNGGCLQRGCLLCINVEDNEFGSMSFDHSESWGTPL